MTSQNYLISDSYGSWFVSVRNASKKAGGSSKNKKHRPRGKARGAKRVDGDWVTQGSILVRQLGLDFLPGLNVSCLLCGESRLFIYLIEM